MDAVGIQCIWTNSLTEYMTEWDCLLKVKHATSLIWPVPDVSISWSVLQEPAVRSLVLPADIASIFPEEFDLVTRVAGVPQGVPEVFTWTCVRLDSLFRNHKWQRVWVCGPDPDWGRRTNLSVHLCECLYDFSGRLYGILFWLYFTSIYKHDVNNYNSRAGGLVWKHKRYFCHVNHTKVLLEEALLLST